MRQIDYLANSGTVFVKVGLSSSSLLLLFCVHICCILYIWIMSWSAGQLWTKASSSYISLTYCQRCVNSWGMSKFSKYLPATRICCNFGINSQSKQQSVSPVKNRVPFSAKVSSNLLSILMTLFLEASSFLTSMTYNRKYISSSISFLLEYIEFIISIYLFRLS